MLVLSIIVIVQLISVVCYRPYLIPITEKNTSMLQETGLWDKWADHSAYPENIDFMPYSAHVAILNFARFTPLVIFNFNKGLHVISSSGPPMSALTLECSFIIFCVKTSVF